MVVLVTGVVPLMAPMSARLVLPGGLGSDAPAGTKPTVMSWRFCSFKSFGWEEELPPVSSSWLFLDVFVESTQVRTRISPFFPASGVPLAHVSPLTSSVPVGYFSAVLVRVSPEYSDANLPRVALFPASLLDLGAMSRTPLPVVVRPEVEPWGLAVSAGCVVPQMSKASPACQVCPTVGCTAGVVLP